LTFSNGLRSILRQDPDVVLVGEVRDSETAGLALQASMTGHLVLTTLHTNDAVSALTRLVDMGVEPFLIASSLSLVVAQRLVRRPCGDCAEPYMPSTRVLALLGITEADLADATPMRGAGCPECGGTGYRGRTGIFEVLPVTASVRAVLAHTPTEAALAAAARAAGMTTMRATGLARARRGETTFEEVLRVAQVDAPDGTRCESCDRAVDNDMLACPWCATVVDRGHCGECARALEPGWKICPWCRTPAATAEQVKRHSGRLPRVLVVGNEETHALIRAAAGGAIDVDAASNGDDALTSVWDNEYDGVIVHDTLPGIGCRELLRTLRTGSRTAALPLMLMGDIDVETAAPAEARRNGVDDVLALDATPAQMLRQLTELTNRSPHIASWRTADETEPIVVVAPAAAKVAAAVTPAKPERRARIRKPAEVKATQV